MTTTAACNGGPSKDSSNNRSMTMTSNATKPGEVNIKGKIYQTVALRVQMFREKHPDWALTTELAHCDDSVVRMKATISDETGRALATGHAEEYRKASEINKTSAVENCETSAIGRALAAAGFGGTEFATADEIDKALRTREANVPGMSASAVNRDEFNKMTPDEQRFILDQAAHIEGLYRDGLEIGGYVEGQHFKDEEKMALWSCLPSHVKRAAKEQADRMRLEKATNDPAVRKAFAPAPHLAEQA